MCGIFGIINSTNRTFNLNTFCTLGIANDSRGGDSCGIFIDGKYEYGVKEHKLFYSFIPNSKLLKSTKKCKIALGHCRKASIGAVNEANAQPVIIKDELGKVKYVLMHNGTIYNYSELAAKYIPNVKIKDMTDSQVMARIFYTAGYDVLKEYIGAGAFFIVDYREDTPKVMMFKGESKQTSYAVATTIERPLYYTVDNGSFIFSSILEYLRAVNPLNPAYSVAPNKLIQIKENKLIEVAEYDRKQCYQSKIVESTYYSRFDDYFKGSKTTNIITNDYYKINDTNYANKWYRDAIEMDVDCVYYKGEKEAHGTYSTDILGGVYAKGTRNTVTSSFWSGVLLYNEECFNFLERLRKELNVSPLLILQYYPDLVHYLSPIKAWITEEGKFVESKSGELRQLFSGTQEYPFTTEKLTIKNGDLLYCKESIPYSKTIKVLESNMNKAIDFKALSKLYIK